MSPATRELLADLADLGVRLSDAGDGYHLDCDAPPGVLDDGLKARIARRRGELLAFLKRPADDLPRSAPRVVEGVALDAAEAFEFELAVTRGELVIEPSTPNGSPVHEAWRLWCLANGTPHAVRESSMLMAFRAKR